MVQRKVSNKLGIQADQVNKSEKRLANLKASSHQFQDGKSRGPDMKKKMKKSRSIKLSDIESLRSSSPIKKTISQPGKPAPINVPAVAGSPRKQSPIKTTICGSPNYMKSTSSSEARKESSQVSSRYSLSASDSNNLRRKSLSNSKHSSGSSNKPARTLTKSSSLKLVRTLTKTPSFKPVRASAKKCSRVVIFADMEAHRATCSSTLKDSKFPEYLVLNPGGTEAEGTSETKVCPYTYCSLNGHHHTPVPPLKCFLSARRRLLKTQKSMKLEALSPRGVKPVGEKTEEINAGEMIFDEKPAYKEGDFDFYIEIYAKNKEGRAQSPFGGCDEAKVEHSNEKQVAESLSDGSPHSEIDFEENLEHDSYTISRRVNIRHSFPEEQKIEDLEEGYSQVPVQPEAAPESFYNGSDFEKECNSSTEGTDSISEATDMEWEEGQFSNSETDTEANYSTKNDNESGLDDGNLPEIKNHVFCDESIVKSDKIIIIDRCEENMADEVFEEQSECFSPEHDESDSEMDGIHQNSESIQSSQAYDSLVYDQKPSMEEAETDLIKVMDFSAETEKIIVESAASSEEIQNINRVPEADDEMPETCARKDKSVQDDEMSVMLQNRISDSFQSSHTTDQVVKDDGCNGSQEHRDSEGDQIMVSNKIDLEKEIHNSEAGNQTEEKEQVVVTKRSIGVQVDFSAVVITKESVGVQAPEDFFEANIDAAKVDEEQNHMMNASCQLEDIAEDGISNQEIVDDILNDENQEHPSESEYDSMNVSDKQNFEENDEEKDDVKKSKIPSSDDSEEQGDSKMYKVSLAVSIEEETEKMEVEDSTLSGVTETFPVTDGNTIPEFESTTVLLESKSNQEMPSSCGNQKWVIRPKRPVNGEEGLRDFNPREPNYLPVVPDPDAEKVDLRHQMQDERKNSEEWMVDYALRKAVTQLAPARKKKVALLVEAFETVMPTPKWETQLRLSSAAFAPARPMQACS